MDIKTTVFSLTNCDGVSGDEQHIADTAAEQLKKFTDDVSIINGNVVAYMNHDSNKPLLVLDAHLDQIGFVITSITDDGFLKVAKCGGIDRKLLAAQRLVIHGKKDIRGVICSTPPHLSDNSTLPDFDELLIDTGLSAEALSEIVAIGDRISFAPESASLFGDRISAGALDDRAGMTSILYALSCLENSELPVNLCVVFSVQEELGVRGAKIAAFGVDPDIALAVDVSFALSKGEPREKCGIMGKGPMIGFAPVLDRRFSELLTELAENANIPYQTEIMADATSTNADVYSINRSGVRTALVSIPLKYMHTPVEICDIEDIRNTGKLIADFVLHAVD